MVHLLFILIFLTEEALWPALALMPPLYDGLYPLTLQMKMKPSSLELFFDRHFATDMKKSNWEIQKLDFFVSYCIMGSVLTFDPLLSHKHMR